MPTSNVSICNIALLEVGGVTITALDENSKEARTCNQIFEQYRDELLSKHPWGFATKRVELAQLTTTPALDYDYEYQLPSDCLKVRRLGDRDTDEAEWEISEGKLLTDEEEASFLYTARITDPAKFSTLFVNALTKRIGMTLAIAIAGDKKTKEEQKQEYAAFMVEAANEDAKEGYNDPDDTNSFVSSRA